MREDVYPEYIDDNHIVFMLSLQNNGHDLGTLIKAMSLAIKKKPAKKTPAKKKPASDGEEKAEKKTPAKKAKKADAE